MVFRIWLVSLNMMFSMIPPCYSMNQNFLLFYGWVLSRCALMFTSAFSAVTQHVQCLGSLHPLYFLTQLRGFAPQLSSASDSAVISMQPFPNTLFTGTAPSWPPLCLSLEPLTLWPSSWRVFLRICLPLPSQKHIKIFIYFYSTVVCPLPSLVPDMW